MENSIYICVFFYFGDISKLLDFYELCMLDRNKTVDVFIIIYRYIETMAFDEILLSLYTYRIHTASFSLIKYCRRNMTPTDDDNSLLLRDIRDCLEDIKYDDNLEDLESVVEAGVKSPKFLTLVRFLVKEVTSLCDLQGHDDLQEADLASEAGMMELSSFLRDLECPHSVLTEGPVTQRLEDKKAKLILLDFLLAETMTARMTAVNNPGTKNLSITMSESPEAAALKKMLLALGFPKPPENITPLQLWDKVTAKVQEQINKTPADILGKPLMSKQVLTEDQWDQIQAIAESLSADYSLRRRMLLTRMDATIQSFTWSDRVKGREGEVGATGHVT